jgi:hypothetical protein
MIQSAIGTQLQESKIVSDRVRITWAQLHEKVWVRPLTTWRRSSASPVVVSQKSASASMSPGSGTILKLCPITPQRLTLVAALRSLPYSFAGSAAGRIWTSRSWPAFDREEGSPDRREDWKDIVGTTNRSIAAICYARSIALEPFWPPRPDEHPSLPDVFRWLTDR